MVRIFGRKREESGEKERAIMAGHSSFKEQISVRQEEVEKEKEDL